MTGSEKVEVENHEVLSVGLSVAVSLSASGAVT